MDKMEDATRLLIASESARSDYFCKTCNAAPAFVTDGKCCSCGNFATPPPNAFCHKCDGEPNSLTAEGCCIHCNGVVIDGSWMPLRCWCGEKSFAGCKASCGGGEDEGFCTECDDWQDAGNYCMDCGEALDEPPKDFKDPRGSWTEDRVKIRGASDDESVARRIDLEIDKRTVEHVPVVFVCGYKEIEAHANARFAKIGKKGNEQ